MQFAVLSAPHAHRYHTLAGGRGTLAEAAGGKSGGDGKAGVGKGGKGNEPSAAMVEDLMEQVKASLWKHHELLYVTFDIYAAVGGGDFSHISINAYAGRHSISIISQPHFYCAVRNARIQV